jgi:Ulp1 protease family, C-terminal catalytic domain
MTSSGRKGQRKTRNSAETAEEPAAIDVDSESAEPADASTVPAGASDGPQGADIGGKRAGVRAASASAVAAGGGLVLRGKGKQRGRPKTVKDEAPVAARTARHDRRRSSAKARDAGFKMIRRSESASADETIEAEGMILNLSLAARAKANIEAFARTRSGNDGDEEADEIKEDEADLDASSEPDGRHNDDGNEKSDDVVAALPGSDQVYDADFQDHYDTRLAVHTALTPRRATRKLYSVKRFLPSASEARPSRAGRMATSHRNSPPQISEAADVHDIDIDSDINAAPSPRNVTRPNPMTGDPGKRTSFDIDDGSGADAIAVASGTTGKLRTRAEKHAASYDVDNETIADATSLLPNTGMSKPGVGNGTCPPEKSERLRRIRELDTEKQGIANTTTVSRRSLVLNRVTNGGSLHVRSGAERDDEWQRPCVARRNSAEVEANARPVRASSRQTTSKIRYQSTSDADKDNAFADMRSKRRKSTPRSSADVVDLDAESPSPEKPHGGRRPGPGVKAICDNNLDEVEGMVEAEDDARGKADAIAIAVVEASIAADILAKAKATAPPIDDCPHRVLFHYPPGENIRGKVQVTSEDLSRLNKSCYLNDSLIDFYVKYVNNVVASCIGGGRGLMFFFSSFFFGRLRRSSPIDYAGVQRWTNDADDLFRKRFVFVPVCDSHHWSLLIIANLPELMKCIESEAEEWSGNPMDRPAILYLDSLSPARGTDFARILKQYLVAEWTFRKEQKEDATASVSPQRQRELRSIVQKVVKVVKPRVPTQNNEFDCGLYLLNNIVMFVRNNSGFQAKCMYPASTFTAPRALAVSYSQSDILRLRADFKRLVYQMMDPEIRKLVTDDIARREKQIKDAQEHVQNAIRITDTKHVAATLSLAGAAGCTTLSPISAMRPDADSNMDDTRTSTRVPCDVVHALDDSPVPVADVKRSSDVLLTEDVTPDVSALLGMSVQAAKHQNFALTAGAAMHAKPHMMLAPDYNTFLLEGDEFDRRELPTAQMSTPANASARAHGDAKTECMPDVRHTPPGIQRKRSRIADPVEIAKVAPRAIQGDDSEEAEPDCDMQDNPDELPPLPSRAELSRVGLTRRMSSSFAGSVRMEVPFPQGTQCPPLERLVNADRDDMGFDAMDDSESMDVIEPGVRDTGDAQMDES